MVCTNLQGSSLCIKSLIITRLAHRSIGGDDVALVGCLGAPFLFCSILAQLLLRLWSALPAPQVAIVAAALIAAPRGDQSVLISSLTVVEFT